MPAPRLVRVQTALSRFAETLHPFTRLGLCHQCGCARPPPLPLCVVSTDGGYSTFDPADGTNAAEAYRIIYCLHGDELTACEQGCSQQQVDELKRSYQKGGHCQGPSVGLKE